MRLPTRLSGVVGYVPLKNTCQNGLHFINMKNDYKPGSQCVEYVLYWLYTVQHNPLWYNLSIRGCFLIWPPNGLKKLSTTCWNSDHISSFVTVILKLIHTRYFPVRGPIEFSIDWFWALAKLVPCLMVYWKIRQKVTKHIITKITVSKKLNNYDMYIRIAYEM